MYDNAINDVIEFLEQHQDVSCVRLPSYDFKNKSKYDSDITPKSINPDSIRHYNSITGKSLIWEGPFQFGEHSFYKNNWHYTSRPCVWRRSFFEKVIEQNKKLKIIVVGSKANDQLRRKYSQYIIDKISLKDEKVISFAKAQEITDKILNLFTRIEFDTCTLFFNKFKSVILQIPQAQQLIPVSINEKLDQDNKNNSQYEYEPEENEILENLLPKNIATQIYTAFLENQASEQGSRMTAMDNATRNAGELIGKLTINYNRTRQAVITKELIEIISGAESL